MNRGVWGLWGTKAETIQRVGGEGGEESIICDVTKNNVIFFFFDPKEEQNKVRERNCTKGNIMETTPH